ncbi:MULTISPECIES: DUF4382 domain-containing protein [Salinibaculum]|uniref:DUF4382 domain-containing protein n=1 Tax=Salinibaculum TaxID=2732368 RepID=UPI0030CC1DDC
MRRQALLTVLAAAMLVLAGCGGASTGGDGSPADGEAGPTGDATGTVEFYVSDKPSRIDDFRHLNVTIDRIGFYRADDDAQVTATPTGTATATPNGTATATATEDEDAEADEAEGDGEVARDSGGEITREVNDRTVDLTRLKGDNATLVGTPEIPAGNYTKVFVYVQSVDATLQDGSSVDVKLPSNKLQLTRGFALEPNGTVQFVYDISVFEAGKSGKYILKPVISESGPDRPVTAVDEGAESDGDESETAAESDDRDSGEDGAGADDEAGEGPPNGSDAGPPDEPGN